jgi:hypothetical protein
MLLILTGSVAAAEFNPAALIWRKFGIGGSAALTGEASTTHYYRINMTEKTTTQSSSLSAPWLA